jgi:hypothetical protein
MKRRAAAATDRHDALVALGHEQLPRCRIERLSHNPRNREVDRAAITAAEEPDF